MKKYLELLVDQYLSENPKAENPFNFSQIFSNDDIQKILIEADNRLIEFVPVAHKKTGDLIPDLIIPFVDGRADTFRDMAAVALDRLKPTRNLGPAKAALRAGWQTKRLLRQVMLDPTVVADGRLGLSDFAKSRSLFMHSLLGRGI